jgi:AraC family transcriptional regulator
LTARDKLACVKITLVERQPAQVACLRYTGPFGEPLARFWRRAVLPWLADHGLVDCPRFGVAIDDPAHTAPDQCRYDACVQVPPGLTLPDAAQATIAGGRYAVTHFRGTASEIGDAWSAFIAAALSDPARLPDDTRPAFEHYPRGAGYDSRTGVFDCQLCLPLAS